MSVEPKTPQQKQAKGTFPSNDTYDRAFRLSIRDNKPIHSYFYIPSLKNKVCIKHDGEDKVIWIDDEEHSSPIVNAYRSGDELIMVTENSIYIISSKTPINKSS